MYFEGHTLAPPLRGQRGVETTSF